MFQHYILTRFNLRAKDWTTTKNNETVLTEEWLEERFDLFENYCFSSVKNQKNQNFKWLVFFDVNTPEIYKKKVEAFQESYKNFLPFFIDGMDNFLPEIKKNIQKLDSEDYIITSRLDNDDCIHENYIQAIQDRFDKQDHQALDIIDGYTLETGNKYRLGRLLKLNNPFISLIEKKGDFKTVWFRDRHGSWKYEKNMTRIKNERLWLSIIHSKNKVNEFSGYGNVDPEKLYEFHISENKLNEILKNLESVNSWMLTSMTNQVNFTFKRYFKELKANLGLYNK
ncbi:putative rhamnosyl transferase [Gramella sp. GC03-9]|uniref:Rhamnosyl transferase n=1 Tax=Christiangramia oceanisediminis TaxID=2920386 RepID=A0A9X2RCZ8_9FLAO|nr:glycosyltransferase [Gramella oceanisediminis]MCP9201085.1 putative rhamnosyl transferase [Gramella oceanisediminis]